MNTDHAEPTTYGLLAEFEQPEQLLAAARRAYEAGYRRMDAYSPLPVEGLTDALGDRTPSRIPRFVLAAGILGGLATAGAQIFACVFHYPLNIGGKGTLSWPAFIPITYELTILIASFGAVAGLFILSGLPTHYHPLFNVPRFERASREGFFLCLESADPLFDTDKTRQFLTELKPLDISEIPA